MRRSELISESEVIAGEWKFTFGSTAERCRVYFKGHEVRGVHSVMISAIAGHPVYMNIELLPMLVKDLR